MKPLPGATSPVSDSAVIDYLRAHPDFFIEHPKVLVDLNIPHASGGAISLIERQVSVLRAQNRQSRNELLELVQIARDNDKLNERLHRFTLNLLDAHTLSDIFFIVHDTLRTDFDADKVTLKLFTASRGALAEADALQADAFGESSTAAQAACRNILDAEKPVCGRLSAAQLSSLFEENASEIASAALLPLCNFTAQQKGKKCLGLLAIGSYDSERFHPAMGTQFLSLMGDIISRILGPHLVL